MTQEPKSDVTAGESERITTTGSEPPEPGPYGTTRVSSYFPIDDATASAQQTLLARRAVIQRRWMMSFGVVAIALAFWLWQVRVNQHVRVTDPAEIERHARDNPNDAHAQIAWAIVLIQLHEMDEAAPVLDQAIHLAPTDADPYAWKGVIAVAAHQESEARDLFQQALLHDASNVVALRGLANLDAQTHHVRSAVQGFETLVKLNPKDADAWQRLGLLLMGARENYRSLDALAHSAALAPNDMLTERALGQMAVSAGRLDQASAAFHIVLAHEPNDSTALMGLAGVMMRQDPSPVGLAAAEKQADAAIKADPTAPAYYIRGQIRMNARHFPEAIADLNTSIQLDPKHRQTYVLLSQCYASAGKPDLAKKISAQFEHLTAAQLARDRTPRKPSEARK